MSKKTETETPETPEPVPLDVFGLSYPRPFGGWESFLAARGIPIVTDSIGRSAIAAEHAAKLIAERRAEKARHDAELQRLAAQRAAPVVPRGLTPPDPDMSALEVMLSADEADREPSVTTQLLDELLSEGRQP